jgi:hypothetical protein
MSYVVGYCGCDSFQGQVTMASNTPAPPWTNAPLALYHGTLERYLPSLLQGIDLRHTRPRSDFGPGFYTTTSERQAREWAHELARRSSGATPAIVQFTASRDALAALTSLWFARGDRNADDYWSLVYQCRQGIRNHGAGTADGWYDLVVGPVALNWSRRQIRAGSDQVSFHTVRAIDLLNASGPRRL